MTKKVALISRSNYQAWMAKQETPMTASISGAIIDILDGWRRWRVWLELAREDVADQHRRTRLGPVWLLINYLAFVGIFVAFFGQSSAIPNFVAYVSIGLLIWFYLTEVITVGLTMFQREESFISGTVLPVSTYAYRLCAQSTIRFVYAVAGCLSIIVLTGTEISISWIWALIGILLIVSATPAMALSAAILGTLFPDLKFVVSHLMRMGIFLTPVFWAPGNEHSARTALYVYNPFTYFLEIVRIPVIYGRFPSLAFAVCLVSITVIWAATVLLFAVYRKQISLLL